MLPYLMAAVHASLASKETSYHPDVTIRVLTSEEPGSSNQPHQVPLPIQAAMPDRSECPSPMMASHRGYCGNVVCMYVTI